MKKLLCLLLFSFSLCAFSQNNWVRENLVQRNAHVRNNVTADQIQFWVGEGSNQVIAVFYWCNPNEGGVAYGFRFNGFTTIEDMLDAIMEADENFIYSTTSGFIEEISYNDGTYAFEEPAGMLMYTINGNYASGLSDPLANNDYFELNQWADCEFSINNIHFPVDPTLSVDTDASIALEDINYWVGAGENSVGFVVNWCDTAIAFAWGVHFSGDSILVSDLMHTIELYDERFNYVGQNGILNEITFQDATYNLQLRGDWWMYNINGVGAMNGFTSQYVYNGDIVKWGDESCGIADENYNYVWTTPIEPVEKPISENVLYDDIVGSNNCQAIHCENPAILGWATGCTIERGAQDIAASSIVLASYGTENDAIGAVTNSTTEVVSLGDAGIATLTFDIPISNGEGYDFAVFENALNNTFLELAFVEVSSDGVHFYRFPSVSNTPLNEQVSNAGSVDTRHIKNLAGKYLVGWGTPFDLEELAGYSNLDINNITHVRIIDVVGSIDPIYGSTDKNGNLINDPYPTDFVSSGFDLAGVCVLNGWTPTAIEQYAAMQSLVAYPNPCQNFVQISNLKIGTALSLYNSLGALVWKGKSTSDSILLDISSFENGFYILKSENSVVKIIKGM